MFVCHQCGFQNGAQFASCQRCGAGRSPTLAGVSVSGQQPQQHPQPQAYGQPQGHAQQLPYAQQQPYGQPHAQQQPYPHAQQQPYPHTQQPYPHAQQQAHVNPQQPYPYAQLPPPAPQPAPAQLLPPAAKRPNVDHLGYGDKLTIPDACACCMGPAEVRVSTDSVMTGSRRVEWFKFPFCKKCRWHMTWSGRFKTGIVDRIGWLFWCGGLAGGVALGMTGEHASQGKAAAYALLLSTAGYLLCMALVALFGLAIARRKPACTCRGAAVRIRRGRGVWHFRFTNPQFEDAFRATNRGF